MLQVVTQGNGNRDMNKVTFQNQEKMEEAIANVNSFFYIFHYFHIFFPTLGVTNQGGCSPLLSSITIW